MSGTWENEKILWKETGKKTVVYKGPIFEIDQVERISPEGNPHPFVVCRTPDWVTVIPELPGKESFLMVRQFRHGSGTLTMEFPAGVVDPGEKPEKAAARELLEETGYEADELLLIGQINPNPAFMSNTSWTYLARGLKKTSSLDLDDSEFLTGKTVDYTTLEKEMGRGEYNSAIMVQAWYWYGRFREEQKI